MKFNPGDLVKFVKGFGILSRLDEMSGVLKKDYIYRILHSSDTGYSYLINTERGIYRSECFKLYAKHYDWGYLIVGYEKV